MFEQGSVNGRHGALQIQTRTNESIRSNFKQSWQTQTPSDGNDKTTLHIKNMQSNKMSIIQHTA